ncbi:lactate utilization protein C [Pasteurella canis]|uniref:Protein YkgG n=1 Tax=Pasteurella canis TaxID=753 RepID=A0A379EVV4_9PAST|nr:lactate utilization protein C [Pasteurella canis]MXN88936.1 lactate utilization protein C [Pasteurella canis]UEA16266.1 lactate utilization protein C [Pasteurella canis]UEC22705.1 lactate utilization protein C [Pasteurella canis]SUC10515.1 protein YkgG [Pasteurella canis]
MLDQQNRQQFLDNLAQQLGREFRSTVTGSYLQLNNYPTTRLTELSIDERCEAFVEFATQTMLVNCKMTTPEHASTDILALCKQYGGGPVILNDDVRLVGLGITSAIQTQYETHIWAENSAETNRTFANSANIGIVFAEYGLTESGGIVLFSNAQSGRSVSLLPKVSIVVLKKSTILPRVAQLSEILHQKAKSGERMPSCVNLIAGPSSTADIELIKVVGVHGPVAKAYLIIDDTK